MARGEESGQLGKTTHGRTTWMFPKAAVQAGVDVIASHEFDSGSAWMKALELNVDKRRQAMSAVVHSASLGRSTSY